MQGQARGETDPVVFLRANRWLRRARVDVPLRLTRKEKLMPKHIALNPRRERFVAEYLVDLNAKQAAIRAGYSRRTAAQIASRLLSEGSVAEAIATAQADLAGKLGVTVERIVTELARIGFSDIRDVVQWRSVPAAGDADNGGTSANATSVVEVKDAAELTPGAAAAIAELSLRPSGSIRVKLHDKRAALVALGKHLGMFGERREETSSLTVEIVRFGQIDDSGAAPSRYSALKPSCNEG
jgi:phage terminase small subunit